MVACAVGASLVAGEVFGRGCVAVVDGAEGRDDDDFDDEEHPAVIVAAMSAQPTIADEDLLMASQLTGRSEMLRRGSRQGRKSPRTVNREQELRAGFNKS